MKLRAIAVNYLGALKLQSRPMKFILESQNNSAVLVYVYKKKKSRIMSHLKQNMCQDKRMKGLNLHFAK